MIKQQKKIRAEFDVPDGWVLPHVQQVLPVGAVQQTPTPTSFVRESFDTPDRQLLAAGVAVTRIGDSDGYEWVVTGPAGTDLLRMPTQAHDSVPDEVTEVVRGAARGSDLSLVATVRTERTRRWWADSDNAVIVEILDDVVQTDVAGPGAAVLSSRRQLQVGLGPAGRPKILRKVVAQLTDAGATPATTDREDTVASQAAGDNKSQPLDLGLAVDAVAYLAEQDATLVEQDLKLRSGEEDVHAVRVATRRARSTLRIFADLFDPAAATAFDAELAWYANLLGQVRDPQVQRERFTTALSELPDELVLGPVAATIEQHLLGEQLRAQTALREAMTSDPYFQLLRTSAEFSRRPPLSDAATGPDQRAQDLVSSAIAKSGRKAYRRLDQALRGDDDELLHRARKAAKRARYAAELSSSKKRHHQAAKTFKELQEILGEHQDSVVAADLLRGLGAATHDNPVENGFTYGILHEREKARAEQARTAAHHWRKKN